MNRSGRSLVVLFASLHLDEETAPSFIESYREIIREIRPHLICAELSPEQLDGSTTCRSKPEYAAAVLPVAAEIGARVVPIQMPTHAALEWAERQQALEAQCHALPEKRLCLELIRAQEEAALPAMLSIARKPGGIEYFQTREYDELLVRPHFAALGQTLPELMSLHDEWNAYFLARIEEALDEHRGARVLITVGGFHKYWLWDRLARRAEIELHDLESYRARVAAT